MPAELGGENAGRRFPVVPAAGWVDTLTPTRATAHIPSNRWPPSLNVATATPHDGRTELLCGGDQGVRRVGNTVRRAATRTGIAMIRARAV